MMLFYPGRQICLHLVLFLGMSFALQSDTKVCGDLGMYDDFNLEDGDLEAVHLLKPAAKVG